MPSPTIHHITFCSHTCHILQCLTSLMVMTGTLGLPASLSSITMHSACRLLIVEILPSLSQVLLFYIAVLEGLKLPSETGRKLFKQSLIYIFPSLTQRVLLLLLGVKVLISPPKNKNFVSTFKLP